ncbi:MAG: hypothetical protein ABUS49_06025 [Acidobacteriota bacterium]
MCQTVLLLGRVVTAGLLFLQLAGGTVVPRLSFEQLTDTSELVVSGTVTRSWAAWDSEHKYIWTHYELAATSAYKGTPAPKFEFAEPGGEVEGRVMLIAGAVSYAPGDQVVVFLSRMPNRYLRTTGWAQGKYTVDTSGRLHASAASGGDEYVLAGKPVLPGSTLKSLDGMSVTELRQRIAAHLRVASAGKIQ